MTLKNYFANAPAPFIQKNYKILCNFSPSPLIDETIILIETDTETFFRHQIFRNRDMVPRTYFRNRLRLFQRPSSPKLKPSKKCHTLPIIIIFAPPPLNSKKFSKDTLLLKKKLYLDHNKNDLQACKIQGLHNIHRSSHFEIGTSLAEN